MNLLKRKYHSYTIYSYQGRRVGWGIGAYAPPKKKKEKNCLKRFSFDFDITLVQHFYFDYGHLVLVSVGAYSV